ncbi:hypothetical protein [Falsibacillus pallidus]|uniref:hypothetical protein n=1 Tax=Falsibacillus pallidus TaxID=493781 RepID=UPI003D9947A9
METVVDTGNHFMVIGSFVFLLTGASVYFYPKLSVLLMVFLSMMFGFIYSFSIEAVNTALAAVLINGVSAAIGGTGVKLLNQRMRLKKTTDESAG